MCDELTFNHLLTPTQCTTILKNFTKDENVELLTYSIKPLSDKVEGLLGQHYIITITYKTTSEASQSFFVKLLNGTDVIIELSQSLNAFGKEKFFYEYLRRGCEDLKLDVTYSPASYFIEIDTMVLENLAVRGYKNTDKKKLFDLQHCKVALKCLAKFHGSSICFEQLKKIKLEEECGDLLDDVIFGRRETLGTQFLRCSTNGLNQLIQHLKISEEDKIKFSEKLRHLHKHGIFTIKDECKKYITSVLHGDLWSNNLLFEYNDGVPQEGVVIDYQGLHYGSISTDVVQMLLTNSRKELRTNHYDALLKYYYKHLNDYVKKNSCSLNCDLEAFLESCKIIRPVVMFHAICDRTITFMTDDCFTEAFKDSESLRGFLYKDRSKYIINSFLSNEYTREIIEEDMLEFMELLFSTQ